MMICLKKVKRSYDGSSLVSRHFADTTMDKTASSRLLPAVLLPDGQELTIDP